MNKQKCEDKMMKKFESTFGKPDECTVIIGDYSSGSYHMKNKEPSLGIGLRRIFIKYGYKILKIQEYNTSKVCSKCNKGICKIFKNNKDKEGNTKKWKEWGLTQCQNCKHIHNRDKNASVNMNTISSSILEGKGRPEIFCPKKK
jgi:hypothetical protein